MKYITEEDLRDLYRKAPFTKYDLEPGVRLTPGARQFLIENVEYQYGKSTYFNSLGKHYSRIYNPLIPLLCFHPIY